jgi:signal transduction histidine kinase/HD-like signal output (HDOD) protein
MTVEVLTKPVHELSARERVELILAEVDQLPTLPAVACRLLAITGSDDSSAADVIEIIESDPSLTAAVLRLVHRADMGVGKRAITVPRAVVLLGFTVIRNLVLSIQVFEALTGADSRRGSSHRNEIWIHSLATACVADMLAERSKDRELIGQAFVCGLLHDIGKIALDACLPKSYVKVVDRARRERACINDIEQLLLGVDHNTAGKRLAQRWGLPDPIIECIWLHHQAPHALPSTLAHPRLVQIVHLADALVRLHGIGYSGYRSFADVEAAWAASGLDESASDDIMVQLPERMKPFLASLQLPDAETDVCSWPTLIRANRELGRINTALREGQRELELRSNCFAALQRFVSRLTQQDRVGDVAAAAAEAVRLLTGDGAALAFYLDVSRSLVHIAHACGDDEPARASTIECASTARNHALRAEVAAPAATCLVRAGDACEQLWQQHGLHRADMPLWLLPIDQNEANVSGILIEAEDATARRFRFAFHDWEVLATAVRLALGSARTRADAAQMNDELLDLNRKLHAAQQLLVQSRSIAMIAEMAAGAAHELNSPLSVISGRSQLLRSGLQDPEHQRALEIIVEQTKRAATIVTDLMSFAKPEPPKPASLPLGETLESLCQHWRAASHFSDERIALSVADDQATVFADADQLREILTAIVANAINAMTPETARLEINSCSRASDETVRIEVHDNGVGMTREVLERALDPFFSSRPAGRGRGLGLSRAYRLAEIHGGKLWLESRPGQGTTVTLELPARPPGA